MPRPGVARNSARTCNSATLQYNSTIDHNGVAYGSGSIALTRLASIDGLQCAPIAAAGLYQGNFYSDVTNQVIPGLAAIAPNGEFAAVKGRARDGYADGVGVFHAVHGVDRRIVAGVDLVES